MKVGGGYVTTKVFKKIENDYNAGMKYKEIENRYKISHNQLLYLIRKNDWKRKSNRSEVQKGNKNAKGNKGGHAPLKNKNAVTTGEYESIYKDVLDDEEIELFNGYSVKNKVKELENELKLLIIRERRMLKRIADLNSTGKDLTINSITRNKSSTTEYGGNISESSSTYAESTIEKVQRIEEALTRIQEAKRRCIDSLHKIEIENKKHDLQEKVFNSKNDNDNDNKEGRLEELFNLIRDGVTNEC